MLRIASNFQKLRMFIYAAAAAIAAATPEKRAKEVYISEIYVEFMSFVII